MRTRSRRESARHRGCTGGCAATIAPAAGECASATLGGALGLAILSAISTSRTHHLLAAHSSQPVALTSGFGHALLACSLLLAGAAVIATRTASTRGQQMPPAEPAALLDAA